MTTGMTPHLGHPRLEIPTPGGRVRCLVCPHRCHLRAGDVGLCGVRANVDDHIVALGYGRVAAAGAEPIEKKPIHHFWPAHQTYSLGAVGCNLRCDFCQNWEISQAAIAGAAAGRWLPPDEVIAAAAADGCGSICFTFTEAAVNLEYTLDVAQLAREHDLAVILLTGGYFSEEALAMLAPWVDCVKIDLKGPDDVFYRGHVGGRLAPVLAAWRAFGHSAWVEVSTVLLSGLNDSEASIRSMADLILETTGSNTPWHLMRFFPSFRMAGCPLGQMEDLRRTRGVAQSMGLRHVYLSNVPGVNEANTYCPACGVLLVRRRAAGQIESRLVGGRCYACRTVVAGCWPAE